MEQANTEIHQILDRVVKKNGSKLYLTQIYDDNSEVKEEWRNTQELGDYAETLATFELVKKQQSRGTRQSKQGGTNPMQETNEKQSEEDTRNLKHFEDVVTRTAQVVTKMGNILDREEMDLVLNSLLQTPEGQLNKPGSAKKIRKVLTKVNRADRKVLHDLRVELLRMEIEDKKEKNLHYQCCCGNFSTPNVFIFTTHILLSHVLFSIVAMVELFKFFQKVKSYVIDVQSMFKFSIF